MKLNEIRDLLVLIADEKGQEFNLQPEDYNDLLHLAQLKHFKTKLGLPEEYRPGMPLPAQAYEITERMTEDLRPFKVVRGWNLANPIDPDPVKGTLDYPEDYYYPSEMSYFYADGNETLERNIEPLSDLEFNKARTSLIKKADLLFPVCNMQADFIRLFPKLDQPVNMVYLKLPKKPYFKVIDNDGYYEYDPDNSIELEWDEMNIIDIMVIVLGDIGISLKKEIVLQYAQNLKERGK